MPEEEKNDEQNQKKGNPMMLVIIAAAGALVVGAVASFLVFKMVMSKPSEEANKEEEQPAEEISYGKLLPLDEPIIVNLAGTKGQRYLKVNIQFEVGDDAVIEEIKDRMPLILDLLIGILSSKTIDDVSNTVGRNRLRREIIDKTNSELKTGRVINVYFTEFVIQ